MDNNSIRNRLLNTHDSWYGQYKPEDYGVWQILGEDPNCDLGGYHHEPKVGQFTGTYKDAVDYALTLSGFISWGGGGRLKKLKDLPVGSNEEYLITCTKEQVFLVEVPSKDSVRVFTDEDMAKDYAKQRSNKGSIVTKRIAFITTDNIVYLVDETLEIDVPVVRPDPNFLKETKARNAALAKLSKAERKLLGLE